MVCYKLIVLVLCWFWAIMVPAGQGAGCYTRAAAKQKVEGFTPTFLTAAPQPSGGPVVERTGIASALLLV